ncbi:hypothetical protein [Bacillus swezeyi]|uniref:hypothetical protein n=1 Tax=Bacillus swezeyi TaxID=1925020 RepID=UPI00123A57AF|nr:hypothetical protein [Bacillus swezeyi]KAA6473742.1 hypothetical protein DX928_20690 [Bacillus swezeyi]
MIPTFEDGTTIGFSITNEDSDQDYLGVTSQIQNGKVAVELGNYEFVQNGQYKIDASILVDEVNNFEFPSRYGDYEEI